jgi:hypothetical protein
MEKPIVKKSGRKAAWGLPFDIMNYIWLAAGLIVIAVGYVELSQGPVNSFQSRTLAPILLVIGYCVLIPIGLLAGKKSSAK